MKLVKGISNVLGIAFTTIAVIYWFDLDDMMIAKSAPMLQKLAAKKAAK
ncbi:hypothetical protein [Desulfosporosinus fructosivorans]|nr:hypothetical protein [Desulfosporosinus fructosivorans]